MTGRFEAPDPEFEGERAFSKAKHPEQRKRIAENIREMRAEDRQYRSWLEHKREITQNTIEKEHAELSQIEQELTAHAEAMKHSIVERMFGESQHNAQRRVRTRHAVEDAENARAKKKADIEKLLHSLEALEQRIERIQKERIADRPSRKQSREVLEAFHARQYNKWQSHERNRAERHAHHARLEAERPYRTIEHLGPAHNAFFLHGTHPSFTPFENSLLKREVSWEQKMHLLLALQPTISASSLHSEKDSFRNLFAGIGVILRDGNIDEAAHTDVGTKAHSPHERRDERGRVINADTPPSLERIEQIIEEGPQRFGGMLHNEYVVSAPSAAALYYVADNIQAGAEEDEETLAHKYEIPPHADIFAFSQKTGLPVFAFREGSFLRTEFSEQEERFGVEEETVSPAEIAELPGISEDVQQTLREEIVEQDFFTPDE